MKMYTTEEKTPKKIASMSTDDILEMYCPAESSYDNNGSDIKYRTMSITPVIAQILLDRNTKNRPVNLRNIKYLKRQVENNNWRITGDTIKIDKSGKLIDGQHRLSVVIDTNKSLVMTVVTGLASNVFTVLDTGRKRDGSDVLAIYGVENYRLVGSAIKLIQQIEKGAYGESGSNSANSSNTEILDYYKKNPSISDSATIGNRLYNKCNGILPPSVIASFHYVLSKKSKSAAEDFLTKLCTGIGLEEKTPINALRDRLIKAKLNRDESMLQSEMLTYIIVAWNKYRKGESCIKLKIPNEKITII